MGARWHRPSSSVPGQPQPAVATDLQLCAEVSLDRGGTELQLCANHRGQWLGSCPAKEVWKPRPGRHPAFPYIGIHRYFLTFCTHSRRRVFEDPDAVHLVRAHFVQAAAREQFGILAYCFMPDHVHLLAEGLHDASDLRRYARDAKQRSGFEHSRLSGHRLWQDGYYDHVLRDDESSLAVARYILENPIRAGLVDRIDEYPHSGSEVYSMKELLTAWDTQG